MCLRLLHGEGWGMNRTERTLTAEHLEMLKVGSGISEEVIRQRGYFTIADFADARALGLKEVQCQVPALGIPVFNVHGEQVLIVSRPDNPREREKKLVKYEWPFGQSLVISVPPQCQQHLNDPDVPLWVTEGDKKADSLASRGVCAISLNGVSGGRGTNAKGGKTRLECWQSIALNNREVILAFDSDSASNPNVMRQLAAEVKWLESRKARVRVLYLPHKENGEKQGVDDFFAAGHDLPDMEQFIREGVEYVVSPQGKDGQPNIVVNSRHLPDITDDAWRAVIAIERRRQRVFVRGETLVRTSLDDTGAMTLRAFTLDEWIGVVERAAHFVAFNQETGTTTPSRLSIAVARDMLAAWNKPDEIPRIKGIADAPFVGLDGALVTANGFDAATGIYCNMPVELRDISIPFAPTADQVHSAVALWEDLLHDFPFVSQSDRANALSFGLTPFVRPYFDDITPADLVTGTTKGSGKGLLVDTISNVATGRECRRIWMPFKSEEETDKRFIGLLHAGERHIHIDNVEGKIDSPTLAMFLTAREYGGRILGSTNSTTWAQRIQLHISGNNVVLGGDIPRRVVPVRLAPNVERPDLKSSDEFRHPDLIQYTKAHRRELVVASLILVQHWIACGRPLGNVRLGSFERWSETMGGILGAVGVQGFLEDREETLSDADADTNAWHVFVESWWTRHGDSPVTTATLYDMLDGLDVSPMPGGKADETERGKRTRLGIVMGTARNRVFGRYRIESAGKASRTKAALWKLAELPSGRITFDENSAAECLGSANVLRDLPPVANAIAVPPEPAVPPFKCTNEKTSYAPETRAGAGIRSELKRPARPAARAFSRGCIDCGTPVDSRFARCEPCTQASYKASGLAVSINR
ncbi:hypothetical protein AYO38_02635 [bacterium SCGC AG-212-C10]|nr:hypothetical protein AYO38_02635 [bacterium SCGC AG-212-C10]